ncbi:MAG: helix-turn-helix domain-containing protein [Myxococcales bacterium]|nr:helix-turn-helix domain-containing protein [Myxococcales bacterium]MCB9523893.1 helix-turn-helix domain-containing protein [Myxococcales bacterium]
MILSVAEAAAVLDLTPRTLRARLARGTLKGEKRGGQWVIRLADLPTTEAHRRQLSDRADQVRATVENTLGVRVPQQHTTVDNAAFAALLALIRALPVDMSERERLCEALCLVAEGHHAYASRAKVAAWVAARRTLSHAVARLYLVAPVPEPLLHALEGEVLPRLGGLIRWAEGLKA